MIVNIHILLISLSFIYAVRSFVEATRYLLTLPGVTGQYLLSERFSQDPLENYFSRQRASGGCCDNPTASNTLNCAQSVRVQGSLALQSVRGNCSHKRRLFALLLMTHHCRKGQGRSNRCPLYLSFTFNCYNYIRLKQIWSLIIAVYTIVIITITHTCMYHNNFYP